MEEKHADDLSGSLGRDGRVEDGALLEMGMHLVDERFNQS